MKVMQNAIGGIMHCYRDENVLAYMGKRKVLVRILSTTGEGAVSAYEKIDGPGDTFNPLIENGKNVEEFKILGDQLTLL